MELLQHNRTTYLLLSIFLLVFVSCEKEVNVNVIDSDNQVVISSIFTPNEAFNLKLSRSKSLFSDSSPESLENAQIQVCKGENCKLLRVETNSGNDNATIDFVNRDFIPEVGINYSLKVKVDGNEVSAESKAPSPVELSHVAVGNFAEIEMDDESEIIKQYETKISLRFDDPPHEDNYYQVTFYQEFVTVDGNLNDNAQPVAAEDYLSIDNDLIDVRNITDNGILISDKHFDGMTRDLLFRPKFEYDSFLFKPKNLIVELRSVPKEYFDYYSSVFNQVNQGSDPFSQPVEIVSNINNGLGIFAGYSKNVVTTEIEF